MSVVLFQKFGQTALMSAAVCGHLEICRLLIDTGCTIDITDKYSGWTALMWAAQWGYLESDGRTALHWAARKGHLQTTRYLVEQGASPLVTTHEGQTPYDLAAERTKGQFNEVMKGQYKEVVKYLQTVMSEKSSGDTAGQGREGDKLMA
ncbi:ankyrin repeat domain-containing protein 40-like [Mytilus trossulus]|uniref:ankyrin repeat domain-containing protein 40-like n=1 Tax=Mytilus trossulus TaxID=6551 RepID=UPI003006EB91